MRANFADMQIIVSVIGALWVMPVTSRDSCVRYDVNGCSIPFNLPFFYKKRFTPSCNRHDVCYRCGHRSGISRKGCDKGFHELMLATCTQKMWITRLLCKGFALGYYIFVKLFGSGLYRVPSRQYCQEAWVPKCLPTNVA